MQLYQADYRSPRSSNSNHDDSLAADNRRKVGWIEEVFEKGNPGIYMLHTSKYKDYPPRYIGRFGKKEDITDEILELSHGKRYDYFALEYKSSRAEAFERLCGLWHHYRDELDNEHHPRRPEGIESEVSCPQCNDYQYELF
jgi:hypothetical protein